MKRIIARKIARDSR